MLSLATLAVLLQGTPSAAPPQDTAGAYLDPPARALVAAARERRARVERGIDAYSVTVRQRLHVGVSSALRERTLFGEELAARIHWRRDSVGRAEVLGARQAAPMADRRARVPDDLQDDVAGLAFDPDQLQLGLFSFGASTRRGDGERETGERRAEGQEAARERSVEVRVTPIDPLAAGAEAHYRYRTADTASIRPPGADPLEVVRLEIIPRRNEFRLLRGSLWVDTRTHGVVRTVLATARPFDLRRDTDTEIPGVLRLLGSIGAELRYVTVEYALWQGRFWLPRLVAVDARAKVGALAGMPIRFERSFGDYEVTRAATPEVAPRAALARADTAERRACAAEAEAAGEVCSCETGRCLRWRVDVPADTQALLASPALPPPLAAGAERLITGEAVEALAKVLTPSLARSRPQLSGRLLDPRLLRYNRVEGLSLGARAGVAWGPLAFDAVARLGVADREPQAELGVARETHTRRTRLAGYRRLAPFDPAVRALGAGASLNALLLGRDEADYFLGSGAELTGSPVSPGSGGYGWRLFAEHQHPVTRNTEVTLARAWDDDPFREVRPAARADQAGAALSLTRTLGTDRAPARLLLGTGGEGQIGTFEFARAQGLARLTVPALARFALALEAAAGSSTGDVPLQGLWYLGGPASVRGYEGALLGGTAFWRARAEVATAVPAARLVLFSDAGWTGDRAAWTFDPPLLSAGAGASFLDGLVRVDLARALRSPTGWRVDLYLDAAL